MSGKNVAEEEEDDDDDDDEEARSCSSWRTL